MTGNLEERAESKDIYHKASTIAHNLGVRHEIHYVVNYWNMHIYTHSFIGTALSVEECFFSVMRGSLAAGGALLVSYKGEIVFHASNDGIEVYIPGPWEGQLTRKYKEAEKSRSATTP